MPAPAPSVTASPASAAPVSAAPVSAARATTTPRGPAPFVEPATYTGGPLDIDVRLERTAPLSILAPRRIGESELAVYPLSLGASVFGWTADGDTSLAILDRFAVPTTPGRGAAVINSPVCTQSRSWRLGDFKGAVRYVYACEPSA